MPYHNMERDCTKDHKGCWICPDCIDHPQVISEKTNCKNLIHLESGDTVQCSCWSKMHEFGTNGEFAERAVNRPLKDVVERISAGAYGIMSEEEWLLFSMFVRKRLERLEKEIHDTMVNKSGKKLTSW